MSQRWKKDLFTAFRIFLFSWTGGSESLTNWWQYVKGYREWFPPVGSLLARWWVLEAGCFDSYHLGHLKWFTGTVLPHLCLDVPSSYHGWEIEIKYCAYKLSVVCSGHTGNVSYYYLLGQASVRQERRGCWSVAYLVGGDGWGLSTQQHIPVGVSQLSGKAQVISNLCSPFKEVFSFVCLQWKMERI